MLLIIILLNIIAIVINIDPAMQGDTISMIGCIANAAVAGVCLGLHIAFEV